MVQMVQGFKWFIWFKGSNSSWVKMVQASNGSTVEMCQWFKGENGPTVVQWFKCF